MSGAVSPLQLRDRIEAEYKRLGYLLGWRLLYSPLSVLDNARVALIAQNPGGTYAPTDHADLAMERGSAYAAESWKDKPPGEEALQKQILALFELLNEPPERVLAGNLVPFRSPSWVDLPHQSEAVDFGAALWRDILRHVRPQLVICLGELTGKQIQQMLGVEQPHPVAVNWGSCRGEWGLHEYGRYVRLPHLSRFKIVGRPESEGPLRELLGL